MNENQSASASNPTVLSRLPFWVFVAVVPVIAVIAIALTGFGSGNDATASSPKGGAATAGNEIAIKDFTFSPDTIDVTVGTPITITNRDGTAHTVTAVKGAFDTGDLDGGASASITVDRPGTYAYFCEIHQYMKGTLRVS